MSILLVLLGMFIWLLVGLFVGFVLGVYATTVPYEW